MTAEKSRASLIRIGYGWDSHEFKRGLALKLGGVAIPHSRGLAGHSDGDVLLHALTDALLGALAAGDIGTFFPPTDQRWKGADSTVFVKMAMQQVRSQDYIVINVDSTLILSQPKIVPHAPEIQQRVAELLAIEASAVGIKAKTPEGTGTDNAAIAHVVVLLERKPRPRKRIAARMEETPQSVVDEVVDKVLVDVADPIPARGSTKKARRGPGA